jgi:hypothetical protein
MIFEGKSGQILHNMQRTPASITKDQTLIGLLFQTVRNSCLGPSFLPSLQLATARNQARNVATKQKEKLAY